MPKRYRPREILAVLKRLGFVIVGQAGSHIKLSGIRGGRRVHVIVPNHREVASGTFQSILRQAVLDIDEFKENL